MKPRTILWDLFGDHLRYLDGDPQAPKALKGVFRCGR